MSPHHALPAHPFDARAGAEGMLSRRAALGLLAGVPLGFPGKAHAEAGAGRRIDLLLSEGFEESGADNVRAVLVSAADALWRHCPDSRWEVPGFYVFRSPNTPITLHKHRSDGRVAIGLTADKFFWSQYAFQFAHEFCHALTGHANDWRVTWIGDHGTGQWFEEALCETGSLFALLAMSRDWALKPPFENWRAFAPKLKDYTLKRLAAAEALLPDPGQFPDWFQAQLPSLRESGTQRDKNLVVARHLLPLFQDFPRGWESLTYLNRVQNRDPRKSFGRLLADWNEAVPAGFRAFLARLRDSFPGEALAL